MNFLTYYITKILQGKSMGPKKHVKSAELFSRAKQVIPGGVNSPVRAFGAVGGQPRFFTHGKDAYIYDVDNNQYIDFVCSWGPLILGHSHPKVVAAIQQAALSGASFGAPTPVEVELAELITQLMPSIEMVRMVNSGTEACMSAIRLARGFTRRSKIIKFSSCYHGHTDSLLVKAGSGLLTFGIAGSAGVPQNAAEQTIVAPYNDLNALEDIFKEHSADIAGIIVEPIAANNNLILPNDDFLPGLRKLCDEYNSLLIFDEVITGFRVALGGAQELYNVQADLTCLGKIIGGGMPVGAFGGRKDIMQMLAPLGPVYQAGTLSGNPVAMAAGLATIKELQNTGIYQQLSNASKQICDMLNKYPQIITQHIGGLFGFSFTDPEQFKTFFHAMLENGVYLAPSAFEAGFVSTAHDTNVLKATKIAIGKSMQVLEEMIA